MLRFFVFIALAFVHVFCQETRETPTFMFDAETSESWSQGTTAQSLSEFHTTDTDATHSWPSDTTEASVTETSNDTNATDPWSQETTEQTSFEFDTSTDRTQSWEEYTSDQASEDRNTTSTMQSLTSTLTTPSSSECPPSITPDLLERAKREIIDSIYLAISLQIADRLDAIEERLSTFSCSSAQPSTPLRLAWQIYENLQIPLTGWLRVFDQPYSHRTRADDLNQVAGICHNDVLVAASFNKSISLAAVGPASVLTSNTVWNQPQQHGQVYWYRTNGKSFGFSPLSTVRQTSGDNEDLSSPLRLSWILDQNAGGYRAGTTRSLTDSSLWRKVIYCN